MAKKKAEVEAEFLEAKKALTELIDEKEKENAELIKMNADLRKAIHDDAKRTFGLMAEKSIQEKNDRIGVLEAEIRDYERTLQTVRVDLDKAQKMIASLQRVI